MSITSLSWETHRFAIDRLGLLPPFIGTRHKRLLFIVENNPLCHAQVYPFWYHRDALASRYGVAIRELPMARFHDGRHPYAGEVDAVCFQSGAELSPAALGELAGRIRNIFPGAKLGYLDWFAPADLRYAEVLNPYLSAYIKKQVLRERRLYREPLRGDTNLTDYYNRRFYLQAPLTRYGIPEDFWHKLWLGPHLAFSADMLPYFRGRFPGGERDIDLHARIAVQGKAWYAAMRQEALDKAKSLEDRHRVVYAGQVSGREYYRELFRAKICFSPFGYGEICWRDFEAMFTGSLLLKPDMGHLECHPELFRPYETYVPVAWDLSDFEEKVAYYLAHPAEREGITRRAFDLLKGYFAQNRFVDDTRSLLVRLGLVEGLDPSVVGESTGDRRRVIHRNPVFDGVRPRILLSAYHCAPGPDTEAQSGWEWYRRLSQRAIVTLVTHSRNRAALEKAGAPMPGSEIIYIDSAWFAPPLRRLASWLCKREEDAAFLFSTLEFYGYDDAALRILRRRRKGGSIWDVVHQVTPVSPLASTKLHKLGLSLVLGPWTSGLDWPDAFPELMQTESGWLSPLRALGQWRDKLRGGTRHAKLILAATDPTLRNLPDHCRERCEWMLGDGVDTTIFTPQPWPKPPSATEPLRVLFVGRLLPFKGVAMLVEALDRVRARSPVELAIVGTGPEEAALRAQVQALELDKCVRFTGDLDALGIAAEMAKAHVFCLPSVREAGGAVLLEAMASARPVIALDYGGPAEIVDDEIGTLISATGRRAVVEQLAYTLIDVMNAPEVWRLRGKTGRTRVEQQFGWDAKIDAALALYQEVLL